MPTWSQILKELEMESEAAKKPAWDIVRRKYLSKLYALTGRNTIVYATKFTSRDPRIPSYLTGIVDDDMQGLMEVIHGLKGKNLDLVLHSPGGSLDATEAIVEYLRSKFTDIRVIVPQLAQSAATMIACSANTVLMGKHSSLGPTDPQIYVRTALGELFVPAQAIIDQFDKAAEECQDPKKLAAWMPMLSQYGPHLLKTCEHLVDLSRELVTDWLRRFMFHRDRQRKQKAERLSNWLADHRHFKSHGRHISRRRLATMGMKVELLEKSQELQDLVLSVFHATTHTLEGSSGVKIIENHAGRAYIKQYREFQIPIPIQPPKAPPDKAG